MKQLADRVAALEQEQRRAQRGLRRWRAVAVGIAAVALLLGQLQPGVAANGDNNGTSGGLAELQGVVTTLTARVQDLESKLAKVTVSPDGKDLYVTGANLNIRNATGWTGLKDGTGNLIIGYNELVPDADRTGSHNLVIGYGHTYSGMSGIVGGSVNKITGYGSSVLGGFSNTANGDFSVIAAGALNSTGALGAAILGGTEHEAIGVASPGVPAEDQHWMTIVGGVHNKATGWGSTVTGGGFLTAAAPVSWSHP